MLFWLFCFHPVVADDHHHPTLGLLDLYTSEEKLVRRIPISLATDDYPAKGQKYSMHAASPIDACSPLESVRSSFNAHPIGIFVQQGGGCDLTTKIHHASNAGASFIAVAQTLDFLYTQVKRDPTSKFSCIQGSSYADSNAQPDGGLGRNSTCALSDTCASKRCILTGRSTPEWGHEVCCVTTSYLQMQLPLLPQGGHLDTTTNTPTTAVHTVAETSIKDGDELIELLQQYPSSLIAKPYSVRSTPWDLSMLWMWILGTSVVMTGSMYASTRERVFSQQVVASNYLTVEAQEKNKLIMSPDAPSHHTEQEREEHDGKMVLTTRHVIAFGLVSSAMLLLLYYVHLLYFINAFFMVSASFAMSIVVIEPIIIYLWPRSALIDLSLGTATKYQMDVSLSLVLSLVPSLNLGIIWFIERGSTHIWPLQDFLAISLCCVFMECIQLPSLKMSTILLSVAFLYDVFFVYVSPYIFGSSVMIAVASEGGTIKVHSKDFCALYPTNPECFHETMPLMLRLPLINSTYPGETMLGLGDIILPGLVIAFALRYDYCKGYPISKNYFMWASIAYALGLMTANIMTVELRFIVAGQPALMYINPLVLGFLFCVGWKRGELGELWYGPKCLNFTVQHSPRQNDQAPLLKA